MPKVFPNQKPVTVETREDGTTTISGDAAVYHRPEDAGTQYPLMDSYYERIKAGAFDRALAEKPAAMDGTVLSHRSKAHQSGCIP